MRPITKITIFKLRLGILALVAYWCLIFVSTHLPITQLPDVAPELNDKSKHFIAYFGLAWLACYVTTSPPSLRRFGTILLLVVAYGIFDELTQSLVPGRQPDARDLLADAIGAVLAVTIYATLSLFYRRYQRAS